jgi:hypothetical protein
MRMATAIWYHRARADADDDLFALWNARSARVEFYLDGLRSDEDAALHDQLCTAPGQAPHNKAVLTEGVLSFRLDRYACLSWRSPIE